jgi:outer membrane receptor protein involved in Fe transport
VPRYTYSLTEYYERGPWALRTSYNFKDGYSGDRSGGTSTINLTGLQSWVAPRSFLDASVSYKISEGLELRLDGMNLQNRVSYNYLKDTMGHNWGDDNSRVDNLLYDGRTIQLGLRGKF